MASRLVDLLRRPWFAVPVLTLGLGAAVAASWLAFGGSTAFRGPIPVLRESWPLIYGAQALLAALGMFLFARLTRPARAAQLALLVLAAWLGEWAVLFVGGTLLANELVPHVAGFYWLLATGGPIQPAGAIAGALLGRR